MARLIREKQGMCVGRHTSLHSGRATVVRSDPELVERVKLAKRQLFHADQLPDRQLYTESNDGSD